MAGGKRHPRSARVERHGIAIVAEIVASMGHIWREKSVSDVGIDGEIELIDAATDRASARLLMVQVKTRSNVEQRSDGTVVFRCDVDDIDYWMSGPAPVLLVLVSLESRVAWFKNLKTWFSDPARRAARNVFFDVEGDRLTIESSAQLIDLGAPASTGLYLRPPPRPEQLVSNLLRVDHMAPTINVVQSRALDWTKINARMREAGLSTVDDVAWRGDELWSFRRFDELPLSVLADAPPETVATDELSDSESADDQRLLVRLLNGTLRDMYRGALHFDKRGKYLYFPASDNGTAYKVKSRSVGSGRTVFDTYTDRETRTRVTNCRHYALGHQFLLLDDGWHLALNPTYHYTLDGQKRSRFGGEYLKKIKRMEGHEAVRNLVMFWAEYLRYTPELFAAPDERLRFGPLASFAIGNGIDDRYWKSGGTLRQKDETNDSQGEPQGELDLGGL